MTLKINNKFFQVILLGFLLSFTAKSQNTINTSNGLPSNKINDILFDGDQYWIASDLGVIQLQSLNSPENNSVRNTSVPVNAIANAGDYIWVGLDAKGLYRMHKTKFTFEGQFRDEIGRPTIKEIIPYQKNIYLNTAEGQYKINATNNIEKISSADFVSVIKQLTGEIKVMQDTLYIENAPFLEANPNAFNSLFKNDDFILLENANKLMVFDQKLEQLQALDIQVAGKINQFKSVNGAWWLCTDGGLQKISLPSFTAKEASIQLSEVKFNGELFENGADLDYAAEGVFSILVEAKNLGGDSEISYGYSINQQDWVWQSSPQITIRDVSYENEQITLAAKNIRGKKTSTLAIEYHMESPAEDKMWNWIFIGISLLIYSIIIIWVAIKKKNRDIKILEDALLDKTNKLNQLEKSKYGLVEEKKVKI